ncbi:MAG: ROK family protein [Nocardioidaceae bacterium]
MSPARSPAAGVAAPGSPASLRQANQRRVIAAVRSLASAGVDATQAEIARTTLLAPATISNIVKELADVGLVETRGGAGRRGTTVRIARHAGLVVGLDFGHSHLRVALGDLAGDLLDERTSRLPNDHDHDEGLRLAVTMLEGLLGDTPEGDIESVRAIGLGLPAPIGPDGIIAAPSVLPGWVGVHAQDRTEDAFGRPVWVDNDANLGALAESRIGLGRGHRCMAYLKVSSGVGAGIVIDGELFHGGAGTAGEIGHLTVDEAGPVCRCGSRGCLEAYTSAGHIRHLLRDRLPDATIGEIVAAAHRGDIAASRVLEDAGRHLGAAVAALANLMNPTCLVVGGEMAAAGDILLDPMRQGVRRHALEFVASSLTISTSVLGERASALGALALALDRAELPLPSSVSAG